MGVAMVYVRIMWVRMPERRMDMLVGVGFTLIPGKVMRVLMVFIVNVPVTVAHEFMGMLMHVFLT